MLIHCLLKNVLNLILQINLEATDDSLPTGALLNQTESKIIFKSLEEIFRIHKEIEIQLWTDLKNWDSVHKAEAFTTFVSFKYFYYLWPY